MREGGFERICTQTKFKIRSQLTNVRDCAAELPAVLSFDACRRTWWSLAMTHIVCKVFPSPISSLQYTNHISELIWQNGAAQNSSVKCARTTKENEIVAVNGSLQNTAALSSW